MNGSRTRRSVINLLFNIVNQLVTMLISFMTRTVFIRVFCREYLGLNAVFADLLGLLSLADLGIGTAMNYSYYRPLAEGDIQRLAALTHFYQKIYRYVAVTVTVTGVALIPLLPFVTDTEIAVSDLTFYYLFSLAEVVFSYLYCSRTAILTADQKNYITTGIRMMVSILRMICQMVAMLCFKSYIAYLAMAVLGTFLNNVLASRVAVRKYPFIRKHTELENEEKRRIYRNMGAVFLYKISSLLLNATDSLLISTMVSTVATGLYSNYLLIQNQITRLFSLVFTSLTASIGNLIVKTGTRRRYEVFRCEQLVSSVICAIMVPCYMALINEFIQIWLDETYVLSGMITSAVGINLYLGCILQPLWSYREATGLYTRTKWVMFICAALNICLSILLGYRLGIAGILFASAISRLVTYVRYEPKILFKEYFGMDAEPFFRKIRLNAVLTGSMSMCLSRVGQAFPVDSWTGWFLKAVIFMGICMAVAGIAYGHSEEMSLLLKRLRKR